MIASIGSSWVRMPSLRASSPASAWVEIDVPQEQVLLELGGTRDRRARVVDDEGVAVEDELVLASDEPAEGDAGEVVARPLGEHPLALGPLAHVIRGSGYVENEGRPRE